MGCKKQRWKKDSKGIKMPVNNYLGADLKMKYYNRPKTAVKDMFVSHTVYPEKNSILAGGVLTDRFYYPIQ